ncbi:MAG: SDR family NAD(P)-dependent oxidoreductase [Planctomycetota bacterium]|nr:SDR family NAD(P)-dependent oxidoreductase [Planctomycetota bacterium]
MTGKNVVVVGGSHGIGFEIVRRELNQGANVTVVSRTVGRLAELAAAESGSLAHIAADVCSDRLSEEQLPERIDAFVYCPGSISLGSLRACNPETMRRDFELNVVCATICFQVALKSMSRSEKASAVFFSSVAAQLGMAMHTSVAASKGAIEALVRTWASELAPKIRVNGIAPALVDTPLAQRLLSSESKRAAMATMYPLARIGLPDDCAALAEFLLSDKSGWITGQIYGVDGGLSSIFRAP